MKSTLELINQGIANMQASHAEGEKAKLGNLRIGGSGVLAMGNKVIGHCMRKSFLRQQGIDLADTSADREHMFAGGRGNEDIWLELLNAAKEPGLTIKREEEYPVAVKTANGTPISGRPDIVLFHQDQPVRILELKLASSLYTALDTGIFLKPKLAHVIQAVHYSHHLKLPIELWYASRADFHVPEFKKKDIPAGSDRVEYNWKGEAKKILPYLQGYTISVQENGQVMYQAIGVPGAGWQHTVVTVQGLDAYFDQLSRMKETDQLPPKPSKIDLDGGEMPWSLCDYCSLKPVCNNKSKETSTAKWVESVKDFLKATDKGTKN